MTCLICGVERDVKLGIVCIAVDRWQDGTHFPTTSSNELVEMVNKSGSKQERSGTPQLKLNFFDRHPRINMLWLRPDKYDENQLDTAPSSPSVLSASSKIFCWNVSKAALRSSRTRRVTCYLFILSLLIFISRFISSWDYYDAPCKLIECSGIGSCRLR